MIILVNCVRLYISGFFLIYICEMFDMSLIDVKKLFFIICFLLIYEMFIKKGKKFWYNCLLFCKFFDERDWMVLFYVFL